jgi:hypothetical protein
MWNVPKKAIALYQYSAIAANLRLDLPVFYFSFGLNSDTRLAC